MDLRFLPGPWRGNPWVEYYDWKGGSAVPEQAFVSRFSFSCPPASDTCFKTSVKGLTLEGDTLSSFGGFGGGESYRIARLTGDRLDLKYLGPGGGYLHYRAAPEVVLLDTSGGRRDVIYPKE